MPSNKIIYVSDLHGKREQYQKLVSHAKKISADTIIIGGDITPNPGGRIDIGEQRRFLQNSLPAYFISLKTGLPDCKVYLMLGNDDCASNLDVLEQQKELYTNIHNKRIQLTPDLELVGYSYVPITPFGLKDWEKYDFSEPPEALKQMYQEVKGWNYRLDGIKSTPSGWERFSFSEEIEARDSIQKDLMGMPFSQSMDKTILVSHCPPFGTALDMILDGRHVGSMAIRDYIEKKKPYVTLHGHLHETVEVSGEFMQRLGGTLCIGSGNHDNGKNLALIVLDLDNPSGARRVII